MIQVLSNYECMDLIRNYCNVKYKKNNCRTVVTMSRNMQYYDVDFFKRLRRVTLV